MRKFVRLLIYVVLFCLMAATTALSAVSFEGGRVVDLNINGHVLPVVDVPSIIVQSRTFVPVRHVFESLGAVVDFHPEHNRVLIAHGASLIVLYIGSDIFRHNENEILMDVAPQVIDGRTMVPISFIAGQLGFEVGWDNDTSTVFLSSQDVEQSPQNPTPNPNPNEPPAPPPQPPMTSENEGDEDGINFAELSFDNSQPILAESNAQTTANAITWNEQRNQFTISATSRITDVQWYMHRDGRLAVDIINARAAFHPSIHGINNDILTNIRTGRNYIHGNTVARVVFDLNRPVSYQVTLSYDRRHVVVSFEPNHILGVDFVSAYAQNGLERVVIHGITAPSTDIFYLDSPSRLVIDLPNARIHHSGAVPFVFGHLVHNVRHDQFDADTARVVVDLSRPISFFTEYDYENNKAVIHITEPTHRNIYHDQNTGVVLLRRPYGFDPAQIIRNDDYINLQYTFNLTWDFYEFFGYGMYRVRAGWVNYVEIHTKGGETTLTFHSTRINAYIITYDAEFIHIRPVNPRVVHPFIVFLDPGHGGHDPGAVHHGMRESDLVLTISHMVRDILIADGLVHVYMSRHEDVTVPNAHRAATANQVADIFVTVHVNAANRVATGTETLYFNHPNETGALSSRQMSQIFQNNLIEALGTNDRGLRHRPDLLVLNSTYIPAAFLEIEFLDAPAGAARLADPDFLARAARAIVDSIYQVMEIYTPLR
ncbi:MAG: N-acetylmuramoyl-L-alanine amidase family protein [Defluviitaleaceae bacterium]|nr:N-acetylmuramoyl-L-alanine amidase family protein [Defluviitaleaceae bacterium]